MTLDLLIFCVVSYAEAAVDLVEQCGAQVGELLRGDGGLGVDAIVQQELGQVQTLAELGVGGGEWRETEAGM